jgi:hypothetical protein
MFLSLSSPQRGRLEHSRCARPFAVEDALHDAAAHAYPRSQLKHGVIHKVDKWWSQLLRIDGPESGEALTATTPRTNGRARFTAHTSFEVPNSSSNRAPWEISEVRALIVWPPGTP